MKLCSINIEGSLHLEKRVIPFLQKEDADVVCLQEVFFKDLSRIEEAVGGRAYFAPMVNVTVGQPFFNQPHGVLGIAIVTKHRAKAVQHQYYAPKDAIDDLQEYLVPRLKDDDFSPNAVDIPFEIPSFSHPETMWRVLSSLEVEFAGQWYRVATTHFTWSNHGMFTSKQAEDFRFLWPRLEDLGEHIVCGDFNSPRGGGLSGPRTSRAEGAEFSDKEVHNVYDLLSDRMTEAVPADVTTTIDPNLHRAKDLQLVVDGIFTTPTYTARNVRVIAGVSDHQALVAQIEKVQF